MLGQPMRWFFAIVFLFAGCAQESVEPSVDVSVVENKPSPTIQSKEPEKVLPAVQEDDIVMAITARKQLQAFEQSFGFAQLLPHDEDIVFPNKRTSTKWLFDNHQGYQQIASHLQKR